MVWVMGKVVANIFAAAHGNIFVAKGDWARKVTKA